MKKLFFALLILVTIFSCSSDENIIKESITNKIKENLKDPDSFEFISMKVTKTESLKELKTRFSVNELKQLIIDYKELDKANEEGQNNSDLIFIFENYYNYIKNNKDDNKAAIYYVNFVFKGTNSFGAVIQSNYEAQVINDENKTTLSVTDLQE